VDQEFVNRHRLFVVGRRLNEEWMTWEYFVKSRKAEDYRQILFDLLYHPPHITVDREKSDRHTLYLVHRFEERPLVREYIENTMLGIEFLWGGRVSLETSEVTPGPPSERERETDRILSWRRAVYTMEGRKLNREEIQEAGEESREESESD
jgi:stage V sporulation protein R